MAKMKKILMILLAIFSLQKTVLSNGVTDSNRKVTDLRLPTHIVPLHYRLELIPFIIPGNFTIDGFVEIKMKCRAPGYKHITLHAKDINVTHDSVEVSEYHFNKFKGIKTLKVVNQTFDEEREFFIINLDQDLINGQFYVLRIKFISHLRNDLKGFFRLSEKNKKNNHNEYIIATQFKPAYARTAFPCFDEPAFKPTFHVSLGRTRNMSSISNMPIKRFGEPMLSTDEYVWDRFMITVPMSIHTLAFVVSGYVFEKVSLISNKVKIRFWAPLDSLDQISLAKSIGPKMFSFFENYFKVSYPLPKLDMVAIPENLYGGIENVGLFLFHRDYFFYEKGVTSNDDKNFGILLLGHELVHSWFGNLVTPLWWTDMWQSEGIATYFSYLVADSLLPDMHFLEKFELEVVQHLFELDSKTDSQALSVPIQHHSDVNKVLHDNLYNCKGAVIIRMMESFLTTITFKKGLTNYLKSKMYKSVDQDELWDHLTQQAHADKTLPPHLSVKQIMDTWVFQRGFPVVHVTRHFNHSAKRATLHQELFSSSSEFLSSHKDTHDYKWWIPVNFAQPGLHNFHDARNTIWLKDDGKPMEIDGMPDDDTPVIFNIQQKGYYKVNYDLTNWNLIIASLKHDHTKIHVLNRAQIINDAFSLALAGRLDYFTALSTTSYLKDEMEYIPWASAQTYILSIDKMLQRTPVYDVFKNYMRSLTHPLFNQLGFEPKKNDSYLDKSLRKIIIEFACKYDDTNCIKHTAQYYQNWTTSTARLNDKNNGNDINLEYLVYCNAIKHGNETTWNDVLRRYMESEDYDEIIDLLDALSCTNQKKLLERFLDMSLYDPCEFEFGDCFFAFKMVSQHIYGRDIAFNILRKNLSRINELFDEDMPWLIEAVMSGRKTRKDVDELIEFSEKHKDDVPEAVSEMNKAIKAGEENISWMERNYAAIENFLTQFNQSDRM